MRRPASAALAVAALCLVAELGARLVDVPDASVPLPSPGAGEIMLKGNPWLLWELQPGVHEELGVTVTVNEQGFRGPPRGEKAGLRLLALGDSSIYGFGVEDDEVFTAVLADRLGVDAVNGGVPGYSSFQALNLLQMRGLALEPDVLVVGTLWSDNNFDTFVDADLVTAYAGWEATWQRDARVALEHLAVFRALDWTLRVAPARERARTVSWELGGKTGKTGRRRVEINAYARNLETFARTMARRGGGVVFVLLANREDLEAPPPEPAWAPYRRVMREVAARWDAPLVDLPAIYRASGRSPDQLLLDRMHPTATGHRLLGEAIADALGDRRWPDEPLTLGEPTSPLPTYLDATLGHGAPAPDLDTPADAGTLELTVIVPQFTGGRLQLDVALPGEEDRHLLGTATLPGPGTARIVLPEVPARVVVRAYLDTAGDGPSPGDRFAILGPVDVPPDHKVALDFSGVAFRGGG